MSADSVLERQLLQLTISRKDDSTTEELLDALLEWKSAGVPLEQALVAHGLIPPPPPPRAGLREEEAETRSTVAALDPLVTVSGGSSGSDSPGNRREWGQPRYQTIRFHARGGLGEVFLVRDRELNRDVALKEIQNQLVDCPQVRARFVREAQLT